MQPYIENLDRLLALERAGGKKNPLPPTGKVAVFRATYSSRLAGAAVAESAQLTAAIGTCDELAAAFAERETALADLERNSAIRGAGTLGAKAKSNFFQGTVGPQKTRTADVKAQAKCEKKQNAQARAEAAQNDNALSAGAVKRWSERSLQLRQRITASYARIGQS